MELVVVLALALIILGPKKLPEAGRSVGKGLRELKGALSGDDDRDAPRSPELTEEREPVAATRP